MVSNISLFALLVFLLGSQGSFRYAWPWSFCYCLAYLPSQHVGNGIEVLCITLQVEEIYNFTQDDLLTEDILILDTHAEVFVWVGHSVDPKEKPTGFEMGEVCMSNWCFTSLFLNRPVSRKSFTCASTCRNTLHLPLHWKDCTRRSHCTRSLKETSRASSPHISPGTQQKQLYEN